MDDFQSFDKGNREFKQQSPAFILGYGARMNFDAAALAYVRYVLEDKHLSPGALAKNSGISASTLTRALNDPKHKFKLSMSTLEKIAEFSGISPAPFLEARDSADLTTRVTRHTVAQEHTELGTKGLEPHHTLVIGETGLGQWKEPSVINYFDYAPISLKSTLYEPKDCFACFCGDDSADLIADHGDIFFCRRVTNEVSDSFQNAPPHFRAAGSGPVIVERRSRDAFRIELTCRLIKRRHDGMWDLLSAGRSDNFEEEAIARPKVPRLIQERFIGNETLKVIGIVEWVIRGDSTTDVMNWLLQQPDLADYEKSKKS
jgi:hypothetical protein